MLSNANDAAETEPQTPPTVAAIKTRQANLPGISKKPYAVLFVPEFNTAVFSTACFGAIIRNRF
jgi:hypothetical protein